MAYPNVQERDLLAQMLRCFANYLAGNISRDEILFEIRRTCDRLEKSPVKKEKEENSNG